MRKVQTKSRRQSQLSCKIAYDKIFLETFLLCKEYCCSDVSHDIVSKHQHKIICKLNYMLIYPNAARPLVIHLIIWPLCSVDRYTSKHCNMPKGEFQLFCILFSNKK